MEHKEIFQLVIAILTARDDEVAAKKLMKGLNRRDLIEVIGGISGLWHASIVSSGYDADQVLQHLGRLVAERA